MTTETIQQLAHRAFEDASTFTHGDIVRLAAFIVDHREHADFDKPSNFDKFAAVASQPLPAEFNPSRPQQVPSVESLGYNGQGSSTPSERLEAQRTALDIRAGSNGQQSAEQSGS